MTDVIDNLPTRTAEQQDGDHLMERRLLRSYVDGLPDLIKADRETVEAFRQHQEDDFTHPLHQQFLRAMQHCASSTGGIDPQILQKTLLDAAKDAGQKAELDAVATEILDADPFPASGMIQEQAQALHKQGHKRRTLAALHRAEAAVFAGEDPTKEIAKLDQFSLQETVGISASIPTRTDLTGEWLDALEERMNSGDKLRGLKSGFDYLDQAFNGLKPGLHIIGGTPGSGKTAFAVQLADQVAEANDATVIYLSWEPTREEILTRSISRLSSIGIATLESGSLTKENIATLTKSIEEYSKRSGIVIPIEGHSSITIDDIRHVCSVHRAQAEAAGEKLAIVIDYLQIVPCSHGNSTKETLDYVVNKLAMLSRELDCPIVLLSALNRESVKGDATLTMQAFRESSSIEYNATTASILKAQDELTSMHLLKVRGPGQGRKILFSFDRECGEFEETSIEDAG